MFGFEPLTAADGPRGTVGGIPRVLNMYENYPFWAVFFKNWGSGPSCPQSWKIYELGVKPYRVNPGVTPAKSSTRAYPVADKAGH